MEHVATTARNRIAAVARVLPPIRGFGRSFSIVNSALSRLGASPRTICAMKMGHRLILDARIQSHVFAIYSGKYDDEKIAHLMTYVDAGSTVLDVGANIGFYTIPMAILAARAGAVVAAFEPFAPNVERLRENLALNGIGQAVKLFEFGLSSSASDGRLALREDFSTGAGIGNASVAEGSFDDCLSQVPIRLERLDDFWPGSGLGPISAIKVDIEGHEDRFLMGSAEILNRCRPAILTEVNRGFYNRRNVDFNRVIPALLPLDYVVLDATAPRPRRVDSLRDCVSGDAFLVPAERLTE